MFLKRTEGGVHQSEALCAEGATGLSRVAHAIARLLGFAENVGLDLGLECSMS